MLESMNIDQAMQEQDELDKTGISLMGVKHTLQKQTLNKSNMIMSSPNQLNNKEDENPERSNILKEVKLAERKTDRRLHNNVSMRSNVGFFSPNNCSKSKNEFYIIIADLQLGQVERN